MSDLPIGWGSRTNQMSEKDVQLGGMAATKFASSAYQGSDDGQYKTSEQVRAHYLAAMETPSSVSGDNTDDPKSSSLPAFWSERQQERDLQVQQMGVFSRTRQDASAPNDASPESQFSDKRHLSAPPPPPNAGNIGAAATSSDTTAPSGKKTQNNASSSPQIALVQVATHTLETLANTMEAHPSDIPMEQRAALASAMKRVMDVLAKQKA